jgi:hypothetical protein
MTMNSLHEINTAMAALREADCIRDHRCGIWRAPDGTALAGDPIESAGILRRRELSRAFTPAQGERYLTR